MDRVLAYGDSRVQMVFSLSSWAIEKDTKDSIEQDTMA